MRIFSALILSLLIIPCVFADSSKTVPYDSTTDNDYELPDDLTIQDTDPHLKLDAASGDDFEAYVSNSRLYISNTTDSRVMMTFDGGTGTYLPNLTNCNTIDTDANGLLSCGTDATGAGGGDAITVNSSAATDPDFLNGDIDWTLTGGNSITATVACTACVDATDMATDSVAADEIATGAVGTAEAASLDIGDDTNLAAGRSLTLSGDSVEADAELYTDLKTYRVIFPTASDDDKSIWVAPQAATITAIWCETDVVNGVLFDLEVDDGSATGVNGSSITCSTTMAEDSTLAGDTTLAAGDRLDLAIASVASSPTWVSISFELTYDD